MKNKNLDEISPDRQTPYLNIILSRLQIYFSEQICHDDERLAAAAEHYVQHIVHICISYQKSVSVGPEIRPKINERAESSNFLRSYTHALSRVSFLFPFPIILQKYFSDDYYLTKTYAVRLGRHI